MARRKFPKISEKKEVMLVFWNSKDPLTASAVSEKEKRLKTNTVLVALRSLLKKGYIEVADIVYSGTVLTRCYRPVITAEEYVADELQSMQLNPLNFSTLNFVEQLLKNDETNILEELEELIKRKKKEGN